MVINVDGWDLALVIGSLSRKASLNATEMMQRKGIGYDA